MQFQGKGTVRWSLDAMTTGAFVVGFGLLLAAAGGSYQLTRELQRAATQLGQTQQVLKEIKQLQATMADLESQQRGFLITGDESLLWQREPSKLAAHEDLARLRRLATGSPYQKSRLEAIDPLITKRNDLGDRTIAARRSQGFPEAQRLILTGKGIILSNRIYRLLKDMEDDEYTLLYRQEKQVGETSTKTFRVLPLDMLLSLTILSLGLFLLNASRRDHKQAQVALSTNEAHFRALFEYAPYGIMITDPQGNHLDVNPSMCRMLGRTRDELIGLNASHIVAPEELGQIEPALSTINAKADYHREWQFRHKEGSLFTGDVVATAMPDGNLLAMIRDTTEQKKVEAIRSRLVAIVESSEDAIIGKDLNSVVTSWNPGATKLFGYTASEMLGCPVLCLIPPDRQAEEELILSRIRRGETVEHLETRRKRKDGQLIDVSVTVSPIRNPAGKIVGASKIARDITERMNLDQQLRRSQKMEAIGQLTGGVAHDFNNLLGVIIGNLDLLERLVGNNDAAMTRVRTAQKSALRGADLTKRLLAFSSRQQLNPAPTWLHVSIENMTEMAERVLGPEVEIRLRLDRSVPPVLVDSGELENALLNLALNARDAMPKGGAITISTGLKDLEDSYPSVRAGEIKAGRYALITVADTGEGMSRETLQRVFEPFFTTKERGKGTGLGLAMVYGFVKQSGGIVSIYSEPGHGTSVTFYLPLVDAIPVAALPVGSQHLPAGAGRTVLVVDDEVDLLEIAVAYAQEMGLRVLHATDGARALAVVACEPGIDLLVTDIIMPGGMNGVELAQQVRQQIPGVKVIYSSGFPSNALAGRSGTKVDGPLLAKPYQRNEFVATIRLVLENSKVGS